MQPSGSQKKIQQTIFGKPIKQGSLQPTAIICGESDTITVINPTKCERWDYRKNKLIDEFPSMVRFDENICFNKNRNIVFCFNNNNGYMYNITTKTGKTFYTPEYSISTGCFSKKDPLLFLANKNKLISYNYDNDTQEEIITLKKRIDIIFACPSQNKPFFICSHCSKNGIYQIIKDDKKYKEIIKDDKKYKEKKLFKLPEDFFFDSKNWAYSDTASLLCLISSQNEMLYVFNIKDGKSKMYRYGDGFSIANMMFHPNKTILILLSRNKKYIEYVDVRSFDRIHHVLTTEHKTLSREISKLPSQQIMTVSQDGDYLFIAIGSTVFNAQVPFFINNCHAIEKCTLVYSFPALPKDIQKMIVRYLFRVCRKAYKE
jgi:WD40 repeat protein